MATILDQTYSLNQYLFENSNFFLDQLLPYDPAKKTGDRIFDGLNEYQLLLTALEKTILALNKGELNKFDPLVGENSCQIRAFHLAYRANKFHSAFNEILINIKKCSNRIILIQDSLSNQTNLDMCLLDIFEEESLKICLPYDLYFLVQSYILTETKSQGSRKPVNPLFKNEKTDSKKVKNLGNVGSMFADNLVRKLRETLSEQSVIFVQNLAQRRSDHISRMVDGKYRSKHKELSCIPYFYATYIILNQAIESNIPIILIMEQKAKDKNFSIIGEKTFCFESHENRYKEASLNSFDPNTPALIFIAATCRNEAEFPEEKVWEKELLKHDLIGLILAYSAAHRQYPDESQNARIAFENENTYCYYLKKAKEWGCTVENPHLFFLSHAYCDKIKNISTLPISQVNTVAAVLS